MSNSIDWESCLDSLAGSFSEDEIRTWLRPLHGSVEKGELKLLAPNRYVLSYVKSNLLGQLEETIGGQENGIRRVDLKPPANAIIHHCACLFMVENCLK